MEKASIHNVHCLIKRLDWYFDEVAYEDFSLLFADVHIFGLWIEQVGHLLKVNLKERDVHLPVADKFLFAQLIKRAENEFEALRHNALAICVYLVQHAHRVRLACASLTVDKVSTIVTVEDMHDQGQCCLLEHFQLGALWCKDGAEDKVLALILRSRVEKRDKLWLLRPEFNATVAVYRLIPRLIVIIKVAVAC